MEGVNKINYPDPMMEMMNKLLQQNEEQKLQIAKLTSDLEEIKAKKIATESSKVIGNYSKANAKGKDKILPEVRHYMDFPKILLNKSRLNIRKKQDYYKQDYY